MVELVVLLTFNSASSDENSLPFSSIHFLFLFFPTVLLLYVLHKQVWYRNAILLLGSLVFFAWGDLSHIHILFASILLNFTFGWLIDLCQVHQKKTLERMLLWLGVILNLGLLFFYKYLGFFGQAFNALTGVEFELRKLVLPLGISYFTFSGISYLVDVSQTVEHAEKNILKFSNYLAMFPKLLQGPITRFGQVKNALGTMTISQENLVQGVRRLIGGLAKKVLIADTMGIMADRVFNANIGSFGAGVAWVGIIAYTLQIYFDFSGYTDMAIGLGRIFGFKLPENFNYPYISRSISDFWRRWHMTLTSWFRTYVFIPLELARKKEKILRQPSNLVIVFLLTGLWHGAGWNFIIWGGYFGLILALESGVWGKILKKAPSVLQHVYSLALIMLGWIIFRLTTLDDWGPFLSALFGGNGWTGEVTLRTLNILMYLPVMLLAIFLSTPLARKLEDRVAARGAVSRLALDLASIVLFALAIIYLVSRGYQPFLYAQF